MEHVYINGFETHEIEIDGIRFRNVVDYPKYWVGENGSVFTERSNGCLDLTPNKRGYVRLQFYKGTEWEDREMVAAHRLVGLYFIPNPENKPQINHMDGIRNNNHYLNLEWCTASDNQLHAYATGLKTVTDIMREGFVRRAKLRVGSFTNAHRKVIDDSTGIIYDSIAKAADTLGFKRTTLNSYLSGRHKNNTTLIYYIKEEDQ